MEDASAARFNGVFEQKQLKLSGVIQPLLV